MTDSVSPRSREDGAALISKAFSAARESGREDWSRMTVAVLKNRLLTLTDRSFDEAEWGAKSMREFVAMFSELVSLDLNTHPPTARLRDAGATPQATVTEAQDTPRTDQSASLRTDDPALRIRDDLWRAALDHSSGYTYYWDGERAVEIAAGDERPAGAPELPRATREMVDVWRERFVANEIRHDCSESAARTLQAWQQHEISIHGLPRQARGRWNGTLKGHILDLLREWFTAQSLPTPADLTEIVRPHVPEQGDTEQLRRFVVGCVMGMTRDELESLSLPVSSLLRQRR